MLAFSEKFANPALAREFIGNYPAFDLFDLVGIPLSDDAFIRMAGAIELLFGLLLISGRIPQVAVIVAGIPFNATLFFLGRTELIGHLPIYGVMLALLVYGSSRTLRRRGAGLAEAVPPGASATGPRPGPSPPDLALARVLDLGGHGVGQVRPEVALDQPQGHVDAGGDPAGGDQVAVVDHPGLDSPRRPAARRSSMAPWWVTAGRPWVRPAAVASMAPVQTVATTAPARWAAAIAAGSSPRSASALAPWAPRSFQPPPGITSRSVASGSSRPSGRTTEAVGAGHLGRPVERDQVHLEVGVAHGGGVAQHLQGADGVQFVEPLEHDHGDPHAALLPGWTSGRAA